MEEFAVIFKKQYPEIPENLYGWLAKISPEAKSNPVVESQTSNPRSSIQAQAQAQVNVTEKSTEAESSGIKLSLRKSGINSWSSSQKDLLENSRLEMESCSTDVHNENFVESFINGIRATFRPQPSVQASVVNPQQLSQNERSERQHNGGRRGRGRGLNNQ